MNNSSSENNRKVGLAFVKLLKYLFVIGKSSGLFLRKYQDIIFGDFKRAPIRFNQFRVNAVLFL
jgi:hypothetical protein